MTDTNYIGGIVKILETPNQKFLKNNIVVTEFRVQFPQIRNNKIINLVFWGNLASDVAKYYKVNDYIIIEGYVSISKKQISKINEIKITVLKLYPFILGSNTYSGKD